MFKNLVIALLASLFLVEHLPGIREGTPWEMAACLAGFALPLLFFLPFLEKTVQKWREKRAREAEIRRLIAGWREGRRKADDGEKH